MSPRIFITACETSADHHAAELIHELKKNIPGIEIQGIGGPQMQAAGMILHRDMTQIASLGFMDVIRKYPLYKKIFEETVARIEKEKPDLIVCLDSPAFNLRLAKRVSKTAPIYYYIAPQLWAWGQGRVKVVQRHIKKMLVLLPFEKDFYRDRHVEAEYVGHPLIEKLSPVPDKAACRKKLGLNEGVHIGLFSGSRLRELKRIFPVMLEAAKKIKQVMPEVTFHANRAPGLPASLYDDYARAAGVTVQFHQHSFEESVKAMDFALVASGTATLETALLGTPFFLMYKTEWTTYFLGRLLVKVKYLGLTNLLLDSPVVPEFIQNDACPEKIAALALEYLKSPQKTEAMKSEFQRLHAILGNQSASEGASRAILQFLHSK